MQSIQIESNQIELPLQVLNKLKGKTIQFVELEDGFFMKPISDPIKEARGFLKNKKFSTKRYFQIKQEEKKLEK